MVVQDVESYLDMSIIQVESMNAIVFNLAEIRAINKYLKLMKQITYSIQDLKLQKYFITELTIVYNDN